MYMVTRVDEEEAIRRWTTLRPLMLVEISLAFMASQKIQLCSGLRQWATETMNPFYNRVCDTFY